MNARTWLWIVGGFIAICVLGLVLVAGAGMYFVSRHISVEETTSPSALRTFDSAREPFEAAQPLFEIDAFQRPRETRRLADLPTSTIKPAHLRILAWDPDDQQLAQVTLPFWVLRIGRRKIDFLDRADGFDFEQLSFDVDQLERIGPALVIDYRTTGGERVLIWTQ